MTMAPALLQALQAIVGEAHVLQPRSADDAEFTRYQTDWRGRYKGHALAIVRPADTEEVAAVVRLCAQHGVAIVPQGGHTGLVGGGVPDGSGRQLVLSLQRLNRVLGIDEVNLSMTVQAGCLLANVQRAADDAGLLFPLSMASEGSCTIGGNLATNAGGTQVLRHGTARELCLGLEAVTAQGEVWRGLTSLRKDNTGYDLRDLLIGSEGTLGIITAASLKLHPRPASQMAALVGCDSIEQASALLALSRRLLDASLTGFELMHAFPASLALQHLPEQAGAARQLMMPPASGSEFITAQDALPPWAVLIDAASPGSQAMLQEQVAHLLERALDEGLIRQACLSQSETQYREMWALRETIPLAEKAEGLMVKHDIGVPTSAVSSFVNDTGAAILSRWPTSRIVCFGHLGDGNLHYNVQPPPEHARGEALAAFEAEVNTLVFDQVECWGGTISAEHGIGTLRAGELERRKPPAALAMMRAIKLALDPAGILNPGRVLRQDPTRG